MIKQEDFILYTQHLHSLIFVVRLFLLMNIRLIVCDYKRTNFGSLLFDGKTNKNTKYFFHHLNFLQINFDKLDHEYL